MRSNGQILLQTSLAKAIPKTVVMMMAMVMVVMMAMVMVIRETEVMARREVMTGGCCYRFF